MKTKVLTVNITFTPETEEDNDAILIDFEKLIENLKNRKKIDTSNTQLKEL